jgi:glutathione S-transferase
VLKIWGRASSLNVQKTLWCCDELGLAFERVDWGGSFGGNDDAAYRAKNPTGKVPTLEDGDAIVWESNTILRYLCAKYNGARLHPVEPGRRSEIERWMDWQLAGLNPPMIAMLLGHYRTPPEKRDAAALERSRLQGVEQWTVAENHLKRRRYLAGDEFTLADIGNGILVHRWHSYPIERPTLPRLREYYDRVSERPSFKAYVAGPVT